MSNHRYSNFVKASTITPTIPIPKRSLTGDEARKLYLEAIKEVRTAQPVQKIEPLPQKKEQVIQNVSIKDLFMSAQNNDLVTLKTILDSFPKLLNKTDDYDWSLLMIACQANAVDVVEELLKRGIDTTLRDKAGNSARSLVIQNNNLALADLFLNHRKLCDSPVTSTSILSNKSRQSSKISYKCEICNSIYPDKEIHLSSTIHNISASKDKKIPTNYVLPQTNRGYQLMVRGGWDRETGLGKDGKGKKYPIKAVQKIDRKGLGHEKKAEHREDVKEPAKIKHKSDINRERRNIRRLERNFRREFY